MVELGAEIVGVIFCDGHYLLIYLIAEIRCTVERRYGAYRESDSH